MNTDSTITKYYNGSDRKQFVLNKFKPQELETLILSSGMEYSLEFLKCFQSFKGGLLNQIVNSVSHRARSNYTTNGKSARKNITSLEGEDRNISYVQKRTTANDGLISSPMKKQGLYEFTNPNLRKTTKNTRTKIINDAYNDARMSIQKVKV